MLIDGLKWMCLIIGTMIGAGYASGRELWQFFGYESGLAIVLFTFLFIVCCSVVLLISYSFQASNYLVVLEKLMGRKLSRMYDGLIILYLFSTTGIMIAGGGATLETFHVPYTAGILIMCMILVVLFIWDIDGLTSVNGFVIPVLILSLSITLILYQWSSGSTFEFDLHSQHNWPAALTFTSLNLLPLVAVLAAVGPKIKQKGEIWVASIGSGLVLGSVSFLYNESLITVADQVMLYEIPLFAILSDYPYSMMIFMAILLWFAIFTTAASGLFGLVSRFRRYFAMPSWKMSVLFLLSIIPITAVGFANLVSLLYPLYGLLNLYLLATVVLYPFFAKSKN